MKLSASLTSPPLGALLTHKFINTKDITIEWAKETALPVSSVLSLDTAAGISRYLATITPKLNLYGSDVLQRTEVDHWLAFSLGPLSCSQELQLALQYLDAALAPITYLVGANLTIADLNVFGVLLLNKNWIKLIESGENYTNIKRWFNYIQNLPKVKEVLENLPDEVLGRTKKEVRSTEPKEEGKFVELPGAKIGEVIVRFPPEASGYLHIGHAKAALLNWYYKELFEGELIMRFDDTNPDKEKVDFEKVILEDLKLLEIYPDKFTHTSQHFPLLLELCEGMLKSGTAYVDDTPPEQMKSEREARQPSRNRSNTVDRNFSMWAEMVKGSEFGQRCCVRAKIDMASDNGCMRDPTIYRCKNEPHPRTGTQYKVYPTYDFACPVVDSVEGVTHALRTMEYHDRDDQYYWFIDALKLRKPYIWEYSRLNMMNTVLSKRKLTWFVEQGLVESWEDPRFPTVRGVLRRGMTVQGLKQFIIAQGSSRSVVQMEWDKIWAFNKKVIDPIAPRYTALEAGSTVVVNVRGAKPGTLTVAKHPKNSDIGTKTIAVGPRVLIAVEDANLMKEGENVTFINWGNLKITKIQRDGSDRVTGVDAELNLSNTDYKKTLKLTWLADGAATLTPIQVLFYDHIITKPVLAKDEDFKLYINKNSKKSVSFLGDPELAAVKAGDIIQLQRIGFFRVDVAAGIETPLVLIHIPDGSSKSPTITGEEKRSDNIQTTKDSLITLSNKDIEEIAVCWRKDHLGASTPSSANSLSSGNLSEQINEQGNLVRKLKAEKSSKEEVAAAVNRLLSLKREYQASTGQEWKPGASPVTIPTQPTVNPSPNPSSAASGISDRIVEQGNKVRQLKADKAGKSDIDAAVSALLSLKREYQASTGQEWKPGTSPVTKPVQPLVEPTPIPPSAAAGISDRIVEQGNKVRQLKADKAGKSDIDAAVTALLSLKREYQASTGQEWKPGTSPVTKPVQPLVEPSPIPPSTAASISDRIVEQGNKVRQLKTDKAGKSDIDAAVTALLSLKREYQASTGQEWKPGTSPVTKPIEPTVLPSPIPPSATAGVTSKDLSAQISEQGSLVRDLKAQKASKRDIEEAVKILLTLKQNYKNITGENWQPGSNMATVTPSALNSVQNPESELNARITAQGEKVRELKSAKAEKTVVTTEVQTLLALKAEFRTLTGHDWSPPASTPQRQPKAPTEKLAGEKKLADKKQKPEKKDKEKSIEKDDDKGMKKQTRLGLEARKEENLPDWYSQVITKGELIEYYDVSGCYILRPWAFSVWESIQSFLDAEIKKLGVVNAYFPMFVSRSVLEREKAHIADFAPEVAWVTKSGESELAEHIAIRPTSETAMYPAYSKWIQSHRDLPLRLNQWNNVVRWEFKHPQPFLRTREFLWQEGHTAFATVKEAEEEVYQILDLYARVYTDLLAVPVVKGRKTEKEKFAGGDYTTTVEAFISASGRGIQGATSHHLGQNFSKMFDITVEDPESKEKMFVYQNSWGLTTRTIGVMIMVHADNQGLVMPPAVSALQVVIVPCGVTASLSDSTKLDLINTCKQLDGELRSAGIRSKFDERDNYSPGWKFNHWELKGVPLRVELGPKDLEKKQLVAVRRDNSQKVTMPLIDAPGQVRNILDKIQASLLAAAEADLRAHTKIVNRWAEFCSTLDAKNIILAPFCESVGCEENIKKDSARDQDLEPGAPAMGAKSLCIPFDQPAAIKPSDNCIHPACSAPAKSYTLFGRSY